MTKYDDHFKLSIVWQYLPGPGGYKSLAKQHGLSHGMLMRWVDWFKARGIEGLQKKFSLELGEEAASLKKKFYIKENVAGKVTVFDGDNFIIEFRQR